jgi:hypothetical protein
MKLSRFSALLRSYPDKPFHLALPSSRMVPVSFHITEVGYVAKKFLDCGGKLHSVENCLLQAWLGDDTDHRLMAGKMVRILELARDKGVLPADVDLDVEIEYEDSAISQYGVETFMVTNTAVVLNLVGKHTDCLAKEQCCPANLLPMAQGAAETNGCPSGSGCC